MPLFTDQLAMARSGARLAACGLATALMGCGAPVQQASQRPLPVASAPAAAAVPPAAAPPQPAALFPVGPLVALPPALAEVAAVACSFRQKDAYVTESADGSHQPLLLRFDAATAPFAEVVAYDEVLIDVPTGPRSHVRASVQVAGGVRVSGIAGLDAVAFHAAHPFVIGGLFVPKEYTALRWESGAVGVATVSIVMAHVRAAPGLLRGSQPCADLAAGWQWFPHPLEAPALIGTSDLRAGTTGIASAPGKPPSASVTFAESEDRLVDLMEVRGKYSRVTIHGDNALIVGWVASSALTASNMGTSRDYMPPSGGFGIGSHNSTLQVACSAPLPLIAEVLGERRTVGEIRARTTIGIDEHDDDFAAVNLMGPAAALTAAPGARLLVRTGDLGGCDMLAAPQKATGKPSPP